MYRPMPSMSVNTDGLNINASHYFPGTASNQQRLHYHPQQFQARRYWPWPFNTMPGQRCVAHACHGRPPHDAATHPMFPESNIVYGPDGYYHFDEFAELMGEATPGQFAQFLHNGMSMQYGFRAMDAPQQSEREADSADELGSNNHNHTSHMPAVLASHVDVGQYEQIALSECVMAPLDLDAPSPSSVNTQGPITPVEGNSFNDWSVDKRSESIDGNFRPDITIDAAGQLGFNTGPHQQPCTSGAANGNLSTIHQAAPTVLPGYAVPSMLHPEPPTSPSLHPVPSASPRDFDLEHPSVIYISDSESEEPPRNTIRQTHYSLADGNAADHAETDRQLVRLRALGWTYKRIKVHLNLPEAESTLRGRHRVLTKAKSNRVRSPQWTVQDVALLRRAVVEAPAPGCRRRGQISWSRIAKWLHDNGASYEFCGAACARKYREVKSR